MLKRSVFQFSELFAMGEEFCLQLEPFLLTAELKGPIVSEKAIVTKKAPKHNCKQRSSTVSRKRPTMSKKAASRMGPVQLS